MRVRMFHFIYSYKVLVLLCTSFMNFYSICHIKSYQIFKQMLHCVVQAVNQSNVVLPTDKHHSWTAPVLQQRCRTRPRRSRRWWYNPLTWSSVICSTRPAFRCGWQITQRCESRAKSWALTSTWTWCWASPMKSTRRPMCANGSVGYCSRARTSLWLRAKGRPISRNRRSRAVPLPSVLTICLCRSVFTYCYLNYSIINPIFVFICFLLICLSLNKFI